MRIDNSIQNTYAQLSSMKRINSAKDDAAGLAISEGLTSIAKGYNAGSNNSAAMKDLSKTADGALSSIGGKLQRIRELAVQSSNGIYTNNDKKIIQNEIDELKGSISEVAQGTEFNTIKLLDGTFTNKNIASSPYGTGKPMSIQNTSLQTLGIDGFDVTGSFDISDIDNAISKISDSRGNLGAVSNSIDYEVEVNNTAEDNLSSAKSQISDTDVEMLTTQLKLQQARQQYQNFAQQKMLEQNSGVLNLLR